MAKRKRRRKVVEKPKTRVNRQASILHAIKCSNDLEWLRQVALVSNARLIAVTNQQQQDAEDTVWNDIKKSKVGAIVVNTRNFKPGTDGFILPGNLFRIAHIRKIKKQVNISFVGSKNTRTIHGILLRTLVTGGIVSLAAAPADVRERAEQKLFELNLNEIGNVYAH